MDKVSHIPCRIDESSLWRCLCPYRKKNSADLLVHCILNELETTDFFIMKSTMFYHKWMFKLTNYVLYWRANFYKTVEKPVWQTVICKFIWWCTVLCYLITLFSFFGLYPLFFAFWTCIDDCYSWYGLATAFCWLKNNYLINKRYDIYYKLKIWIKGQEIFYHKPLLFNQLKGE